MADKTLNEELAELKTSENKFQNDNAKVAKFSYTKKAYDNETVAGVSSYNFNQEQNIPLGDAEILDTDNILLEKGFRSQGASMPRMLANHFFGRVSYNLNKVHDNVYKLVKALVDNLGDYKKFATLDENGRIPYSQLPESALELKGFWDASTNTTDNPDQTSLIDGTGTKGDFYFCSKEGWFDSETGTGSLVEITGYVHFVVNDRILYNNGVWGKMAGGAVASVNGQTGAVELTGDDIPVSAEDDTPISEALENVDADAVIDVEEELPAPVKNKVYRVDKTHEEETEEWKEGTGGKVWTQSSKTDNTFNAVCIANDLFVACSSSVGLWWSVDGKTWNQSNKTDKTFNAVYFANGIWLAVGEFLDVCAYKSTDGKNWTAITSLTRSFKSMCYGNGIWVALLSDAVYWSSTNGDSWQKSVESTIDTDYPRVCFYANGIFLVGTDNKGLFWSNDGKYWTKVNQQMKFSANSIHYADGLYVAIGLGETWSTDGKNWSVRSTVTFTNTGKSEICKENGIWVGACDQGLIWSADGKSWTKAITGNYKAIAYKDGIWVAGSADGLWYSEAEHATITVHEEHVYAKDTELLVMDKFGEELGKVLTTSYDITPIN